MITQQHYPCPECEIHSVNSPLARQKMYRHLLGHGYTECEAEEYALTIPLPNMLDNNSANQ